jgi:hypothetical protein
MEVTRTYSELRGNSCIRTVTVNTDKDIVTIKKFSGKNEKHQWLTGSEFNPKVGFPSGVVQTWVYTGSELFIC